MTISEAAKRKLNDHLQVKLDNHSWLQGCLQGKIGSFPYSLNESGRVDIGKLVFSNDPSATSVAKFKDQTPLFLANIPMGRLPSKICDYTEYHRLLGLMKDESFSTVASASSRMSKRQLALVLAVNQMHSIDSELNGVFFKFIKGLPKIENVVNRCFGFFWKPKWEKRAVSSKIYTVYKAFRLLKSLSAIRAEEVRCFHEQPQGLGSSITAQIPFQQLRETIKTIRFTSEFLQAMEQAAPQSPIYYLVMDADCLSLRGAPGGVGLFSRLSTHIIARHYPSIISLGYRVSDNELPLIKLAVEIDMAVREAMAVTSVPYLPEPCTGFRVREPGQGNILRGLSFIGRGNALETRRLRASGLEHFGQSVVFIAEGAIVTTTPSRMKTLKNQSFPTLSAKQVKLKECLKALRGLPQSHAFPKQWADIFYSGLDFSTASVVDATTPMMHIFSVYDPISRMFKADRYSSKVFDLVMEDYDKPLSAGQQAVLSAARIRLLSLNMNAQMITIIEETAIRLGKAIYRILNRYASSH